VQSLALKKLFSGGRLFDAVDADADRNLAGDRTRFRNAKGMRCELNPFRADGRGDVHTIVHDEPASGLRLPHDERLGQLVKTPAGSL